MWARLKLNIEILGYNRAIGHMKSQAGVGVTQNMIDGLITERNKVEDCLVALKKEQREARFGRTLTA
jgi:hypothetical protein